jgi:hypothetical protein
MPWAAVADAAGNVYVGGDFDTYSAFGNRLIAAPHVNAIGNGYFSQTFVAKFDQDGNHQWTRLAQSPSLASLRDLVLAPDGVWGIGFTDDRARFGSLTVYGPGICLGGPICSMQYLTGGWIGKITESAGGGANPITLLNPQHDGSHFTFSFQSQAGFTHFVLYRTNLATGSWQTNSSVSGDGTVKHITLPLTVFGPARQGFVRVQTQ